MLPRYPTFVSPGTDPEAQSSAAHASRIEHRVMSIIGEPDRLPTARDPIRTSRHFSTSSSSTTSVHLSVISPMCRAAAAIRSSDLAISSKSES